MCGPQHKQSHTRIELIETTNNVQAAASYTWLPITFKTKRKGIPKHKFHGDHVLECMCTLQSTKYLSVTIASTRIYYYRSRLLRRISTTNTYPEPQTNQQWRASAAGPRNNCTLVIFFGTVNGKSTVDTQHQCCGVYARRVW